MSLHKKPETFLQSCIGFLFKTIEVKRPPSEFEKKVLPPESLIRDSSRRSK